MKTWISSVGMAITLFVLAIGTPGDCQEVPACFVGTWKVESTETYEQWTRASNGKDLVGLSYQFVDGQKKITEHLRIKQADGKVVYSATVPTQNDGQPILFVLNRVDERTYSFENLTHDFPKKIIYQLKDDARMFVQVSGDEGQGFSFFMSRESDEKAIPKWFFTQMQCTLGNWVADDQPFQSEGEPFDAYGKEWKWGIGKTSIVGRIYGIRNGMDVATFWELRQYWDNVKQEAVLIQFGRQGVEGVGTSWQTAEGVTESRQLFSKPDGTEWQEKHIVQWHDGEMTTTSLAMDSEGLWKEIRTYHWKVRPVPEKPKE